jgi:general secretion pathway protein E
MGSTDFAAYLAGKGILRDQAVEAASVAKGRDASTGPDWLSLTKLTPSALANELAAFYGCDRVQRAQLIESPFAGAGLSQRFLREKRVFPFESEPERIMLAVAAPIDPETVRAIEVALRKLVTIAVATADDIEAALTASLEAEPAENAAPEDVSTSGDNLDELRDLAQGGPVVRAVDDLLRLAVEQRATDLHIEPFNNTLRTRLRIDGLLKAVPSPPLSMAKGLLSRIKIMAGLNITERRLPQDGRARIVINGAEIDLRVATMPTMSGEGVVIRLLRKGSGVVALDQIGLSASRVRPAPARRRPWPRRSASLMSQRARFSPSRIRSNTRFKASTRRRCIRPSA